MENTTNMPTSAEEELAQMKAKEQVEAAAKAAEENNEDGDDNDENEHETAEEAEMRMLKARAAQLGLRVSHRIKLDTLRAKVRDAIEGSKNDDQDDEDDESGNDGNDGDAAPTRKLSKQEQFIATRNRLKEEQMKLIRVRISCLNPEKREWAGEFITVGNKYLGNVKKFIPFGEATDNGYHVPQVLLTKLQSRKFLQKITRRNPKTGNLDIKTRFVPEFGIEILPPLTKDELRQLANQQRAAQGLD